MSAREPESIARSIERTEQLLSALDGAPPELLSVSGLNRALRQVLTNQVVILGRLGGLDLGARALGGIDTAPSEGALPQARASEPPPDPIRDADTSASAETSSKEPRNGQAAKASNGQESDSGRFARHIRFEVPETLPIRAPTGDTEALSAGEPSLAAELLNETRILEAGLARACVAQFDNRDNDYAKGLEKLNRWTAGGTGGTPFQWRGERAYLNVNGASPSGVRNYDEQLMNRMGFSRRIGRLVVPGLQGEVVVYERP